MRLSADTLKSVIDHKLDSIEGSFTKQVDSLKHSYGQTKSKIENMKGGYQQKIDSLNNLKLPTGNYSHKVDSLNNKLAQVQQKAAAKIDSLKGRVTAKLKSLNLPPQAGERISKLTSSVDKISLPSIDADINSKIGLDNINTSVPGLPAVGINTDGLPSAGNLSSTNTGLPSLPGTNIQGNMNQLNQVTEKAGVIRQQVQEGVSVEQAGQAIEDKASQLDQVKAIQAQTVPGQPGALPLGVPANSDQAKEQLAALAKKEAVNHFSGKEAALMSAMDKLSTYKKKYNSVSSIKDLPDKRPNPLKEKPFIERLVPGITLQFQSFRYFMLDVNVSAGYRFTERITAGLGWNQRWAYSTDSKEFSPAVRIYGVRSYGEFNIKKGFSVRADVECMNTFVRQTITGAPETGHREWVWSAFTGVKQEYRISKNLKGNAQAMYNLFDPHHKSPYTDRLNVRIGLELVLKKKKKDKASRT